MGHGAGRAGSRRGQPGSYPWRGARERGRRAAADAQARARLEPPARPCRVSQLSSSEDAPAQLETPLSGTAASPSPKVRVRRGECLGVEAVEPGLRVGKGLLDLGRRGIAWITTPSRRFCRGRVPAACSPAGHQDTTDHTEDAIRAGEAALLHIDRSGADQNREESLRGIPTRSGYDRDEYPPAVSSEGGSGADVRYSPSASGPSREASAARPAERTPLPRYSRTRSTPIVRPSAPLAGVKAIS